MSYILQDREGDSVEGVESTGLETVKWHFVFTKQKKSAKVFEYDDLFSRLATNPVGTEFLRGFAGGRVIEC